MGPRAGTAPLHRPRCPRIDAPGRVVSGSRRAAPVPLLGLDNDVGILLRPGKPVEVFGTGSVRLEGEGIGDCRSSDGSATLRLYHRTPHAADILANGFVDSTVNPTRDGAWEGTWFSDTPMPATDGVEGGTVLVLELPSDVADAYRWKDPSKPIREFVLPARIANRYGPPRVHGRDGIIRDAATAAEDRDRWSEYGRSGG